MKKYKETQVVQNAILNEPSLSYAPGSFFELSMRDISKNYIRQIMRLSKLSVLELISILPISIDTYKRKLAFNPPVTEKILEIEEVYRKGLTAFGDSFHQWMNTENIAFGGVTPKTLLSNSFGVRLLLNEIGRLEHGILA